MGVKNQPLTYASPSTWFPGYDLTIIYRKGSFDQSFHRRRLEHSQRSLHIHVLSINFHLLMLFSIAEKSISNH